MKRPETMEGMENMMYTEEMDYVKRIESAIDIYATAMRRNRRCLKEALGDLRFGDAVEHVRNMCFLRRAIKDSRRMLRELENEE